MQLLLCVGGLGIGIKHDTLEIVDGIIMDVDEEVIKIRAFERVFL